MEFSMTIFNLYNIYNLYINCQKQEDKTVSLFQFIEI